MILTSARFNAALNQSHKVCSRVSVYKNGQPTGTLLKPSDGEVTADVGNVIRRTCRLTINDPTLAPSDPSDLLAPFGNELVVERGIEFSDGTREYVPLGIFGINRTLINDTGVGFEMIVEGFDRSRHVARNQFTDHYTIADGTNIGSAVASIVTSRYPSAVLNFAPTSATCPAQVYDAGQDPWEAASDLATSIGYELFVDPSGTFIFRPVPDPRTAPVTQFYDEGIGSLLTYVQRSLDDQDAANYVVVSGEHPGKHGTIPRAVAQDTNPNSPTYVSGPYGMVVKSIIDRTLETQAQAQALANATLYRNLGLLEQVTAAGILHPGQEPGDVVEITRSRAGAASFRYSIDQMVISLTYLRPIAFTVRRRF